MSDTTKVGNLRFAFLWAGIASNAITGLLAVLDILPPPLIPLGEMFTVFFLSLATGMYIQRRYG